MVFMCGLYFALRSGKEHRQLRFDPCQIEVIEQPGERPFVVYIEDTSKNEPGGLKEGKSSKKLFSITRKKRNQRCFVRVFKLYNSLCPFERPKGTFYLQPLKKQQPDCWFSVKSIRRNTLEETVTRLCAKAGIPGFKMNHSLRATTATRLYQAGVDEQLIMERTGHRSIKGVRSCKRTSQERQETLSYSEQTFYLHCTGRTCSKHIIISFY